jgi:hypothetical protein
MQLPSPDDPQAVFAYAMTFNAYEKYGSLEAAAALARRAPRTTLDEVRAELFFKARASRHRGDDGYLHVYRELLPLLKQFGDGGAT